MRPSRFPIVRRRRRCPQDAVSFVELSCLRGGDKHRGMPETPESIPPPLTSPSLWNLFISFVTISLLGFGGTLAWARRMAVDERRWMSATEFNEVFALCQFLPGPNVANFAVVFG